MDGYNITDALAGKSASPRHESFYFNDDGSLVALRYDQWKLVFAEQRAHGFDVRQEPFVPLRDGDQLLLCTDGLTDMVPETEIAQLLAEPRTAQQISQLLVDAALAHGGKDNVTVVVGRYAVAP